ncbi:hypothetical protein TOC8171_11630 [Pseudomonas syringae]
MLGELGFRNCEEALRGFLMGGKSPGRPRKRWREMERVEGTVRCVQSIVIKDIHLAWAARLERMYRGSGLDKSTGSTER